MKKTIRMTESDLRNHIKNSIMEVINERFGESSAPEQVQQEIAGMNCSHDLEFEVANGEYFLCQWDYDAETNQLYAGFVSNSGMAVGGAYYAQEYDYDFSLDENLQSFVEELENKVHEEYGWPDMKESKQRKKLTIKESKLRQYIQEAIMHVLSK